MQVESISTVNMICPLIANPVSKLMVETRENGDSVSLGRSAELLPWPSL